MKNILVIILGFLLAMPLVMHACNCTQWKSCQEYKNVAATCWHTCIGNLTTTGIYKCVSNCDYAQGCIDTCRKKELACRRRCYRVFGHRCPFAVLDCACDEQCAHYIGHKKKNGLRKEKKVVATVSKYKKLQKY
jgi:hypothetical protein